METQQKDVFAMMTNRIVAQMENGTMPWLEAWIQGQLPQNLITRKRYRGINTWWLNSLKYPTNYFITFQQAKDIGARICKGEKGHPVAYWSKQEHAEAPLQLKYSTVFNIAQCSGINEDKIPPQVTVGNPYIIFDEIIATMPDKPVIEHVDTLETGYNINEDIITVPRIGESDDPMTYYLRLFQALVNSTGAAHRLNRKQIVERQAASDGTYSMEELVSIMGATYLLGFAGVETAFVNNLPDSCEKWMEVFKQDKRFVVYSAAHAQKAVDYILGYDFTTTGITEPSQAATV